MKNPMNKWEQAQERERERETVAEEFVATKTQTGSVEM